VRQDPLYFPYAANLNRLDRGLLAEDESVPALTLDEVLAHRAAGAIVLDGRPDREFAPAHLRGSVNVGLEGRFAEYAGDVIRPDQAVVLVAATEAAAMEAKVRLARIGFDRVVGALVDPIPAYLAHPELLDRAARITATDLAARRRELAALQIVDVRNEGEARVAGVIEGAAVIPLPRLLDRLGELDPARPTVVHCAGGYRSSIAASVLRANGFVDVSDLQGGFGAWADAGHPVGRLAV